LLLKKEVEKAMSTKTDLIARVPLFSPLKDADLEWIAKLTQAHTFQSGDVIVREGDKDRRLFVMMSGEVEVVKGLGSKNEWRMRTLGPHSYFGEMALIDESARSASVIAKMETEVLALDHRNLRQAIEKNPAIAFELLQKLSRRIRELEEAVTNTLGAVLPLLE
jgi:CRP-like cAMP-binding protein